MGVRALLNLGLASKSSVNVLQTLTISSYKLGRATFCKGEIGMLRFLI